MSSQRVRLVADLARAQELLTSCRIQAEHHMQESWRYQKALIDVLAVRDRSLADASIVASMVDIARDALNLPEKS